MVNDRRCRSHALNCEMMGVCAILPAQRSSLRADRTWIQQLTLLLLLLQMTMLLCPHLYNGHCPPILRSPAHYCNVKYSRLATLFVACVVIHNT